MISPMDASTIVFPVSRDETLKIIVELLSLDKAKRLQKIVFCINFKKDFLLAYKLLMFYNIFQKHTQKLASLLKATLCPHFLGFSNLCHSLLHLNTFGWSFSVIYNLVSMQGQSNLKSTSAIYCLQVQRIENYWKVQN